MRNLDNQNLNIESYLKGILSKDSNQELPEKILMDGYSEMPLNNLAFKELINIIENPKNLRFVEAEASLLPSILKDVEAAFINTNFAVAAGINANEQGILIAPTDNTYANIIASRKGDEESEKIQVLKKALTSDEARDFINNEYKGTIIPIF